MACAITKGRGVGCKTAFAGIKNIYILDYSAAIAALGDSSGTITLPTDNSAEFFKFEVKGAFNRRYVSIVPKTEVVAA